MTHPDPALEEARERWHDRSGAWTRHAEWIEAVFRPVTERILREVADRRPRAVLDLACGTGVLTAAIVRGLSPGATVLAFDLAEGMVEATRSRIGGLRGVRVEVAEAERAPLPAAGLDLAVCRYGLMLMNDPVAVAARVRSALAPGGVFLASVWTTPPENPLLSLPARILSEAAGVVPDPAAKGPCTLGAPGALGSVLARGGFEGPVVRRVEQAWEAPSIDAILERILAVSGSAHRLVEALGPRADEALGRVREALRPWERPDGSVVVPAASWFARAEVPA